VSSRAAPRPRPPPPFPYTTLFRSVAGGLTRSRPLTGLHLGAEYSLTRDRWFGLRVEAGTNWTPTQTHTRPTSLYGDGGSFVGTRSEEHTSELQSLRHLVCRLLLEK